MPRLLRTFAQFVAGTFFDNPDGKTHPP